MNQDNSRITDPSDSKGRLRIIQETVPGRQITLAHIIANPRPIVYKKLGLNPSIEYSSAAIGISPCVNREVIGIVTQIDWPDANVAQAEEWLRLTGCEKIFHISSYTGEGVWQILDYLKEPGDVMPWDTPDKQNDCHAVYCNEKGDV